MFLLFIFCHQKPDVIPTNKIWISIGMNDVNYNVERSKDFQSDTCKYIIHVSLYMYFSKVFFPTPVNWGYCNNERGRI